MTLRRIFTLSIISFILMSMLFALRGSHAQTPPTFISGKFYRFDVIATSGTGGLTGVFPGPSINDNGVVAFSGRTTGGGVFVSPGAGVLRNVTPRFEH